METAGKGEGVDDTDDDDASLLVDKRVGLFLRG
jgi:hypothetical protein